MLNETQINQIKAKMQKDNLKETKLARRIKSSTGNLKKMLNKEKDFPNIEKRIKKWLYNRNSEVINI